MKKCKLLAIKSLFLLYGLITSVTAEVNAQQTLNESRFYVSAVQYVISNWDSLKPLRKTNGQFDYLSDSVEFVCWKRVHDYPFSRIFQNEKFIDHGFIKRGVRMEDVWYYHSIELLSDTFILKPFLKDERLASDFKHIIWLGVYAMFEFESQYFVPICVSDPKAYLNNYVYLKMDISNKVLDFISEID